MRGQKVRYEGKLWDLNELCAKHNIKTSTYKTRRDRGIPMKEALEVPVNNKMHRHVRTEVGRETDRNKMSYKDHLLAMQERGECTLKEVHEWSRQAETGCIPAMLPTRKEQQSMKEAAQTTSWKVDHATEMKNNLL